jgi:hypothetical protein
VEVQADEASLEVAEKLTIIPGNSMTQGNCPDFPKCPFVKGLERFHGVRLAKKRPAADGSAFPVGAVLPRKIWTIAAFENLRRASLIRHVSELQQAEEKPGAVRPKATAPSVALPPGCQFDSAP